MDEEQDMLQETEPSGKNKKKVIIGVCVVVALIVVFIVVLLLLLGSCSHHHTMEFIPTVEATCEQPGIIEHWHCSDCGEDFEDEKGERPLDDGDLEIPIAQHTPEIIPAVEPGCETTGLTEGSRCSDCGVILKAQEVVDAVGHDIKVETTKAPTCTQDGYEEGTCRRCEEEISRVLPATGHTPEIIPGKAPTCTETGLTDEIICSVCGEILEEQGEIPALNHLLGEPVREEGVAATCTKNGYYFEVTYCLDCGVEYSRTAVLIEALGHTPETIPGKAATCTETGLTDGERCSVCGAVLKAQKEIPALDHSFTNYISNNDATCTQDGTETAKCDRCEETNTRTVEGSAKGHDYTNVTPVWTWTLYTEATAAFTCTRDGCGHEEKISAEISDEVTIGATCTTEGLRTYTAQVTLNGQNYTDTRTETIPAAEHSWGEWTQTKAPTCTAEGEEQRVCANDPSHVETRAIAKTAHNFVHYEGKAATCTSIGWEAYDVCTDCKYSTYREIPMMGHTPGEAVEENQTAATCTKNGSYDEVVYCTVCDEELSRKTVTVEAAHTPQVIPAVAPGCETAGFTEGLECAVCGEVLVPQFVLSPSGHTPETVPGKAATCTETGLTDGEKCSVCDKILKEQEIIEALGHEIVNNKCVNCGMGASENLQFELSGDGQYYILAGIGTCTDEDILVPDVYNGRLVESINNSAFSGVTRIKAISIPHSVTEIGSSAFENCSSLVSVTIGANVKSISANAFEGCTSLIGIRFAGETDGWSVTKDPSAPSGEAVPESELSSPEKAAQLFTETYLIYRWLKSDDTSGL